MAKAKKGTVITTQPSVYEPPGFTAKEAESNYKRDYEFNQAAPKHSPVQGWEYKWKHQDGAGSYPKEQRMINATPSSFKGRRTGNSYGARPATRKVGKR